MNKRDVFRFLQEVGGVPEKVLRFDRYRKPLDTVFAVLGELDGKLLNHRPDKRQLRFDLPMGNAFRIGVNARDTGHEIRKIADVREKLTCTLDARLQLDVVAVTCLYRKHMVIPPCSDIRK